MLVTIQNEKLTVSADTLGAQLMSIRSDLEYLWQGDDTYWADRSPMLFPFVGRLTNGSYRLGEKVYPLDIHGFARKLEYTPVNCTETAMTFRLEANEKTLQAYPFRFVLEITYALEGAALKITYAVENKSETVMPFGIGGHPGFRAPLVEGERFEDYVLEFSQVCQPDRVGFSPAVYLNGQDEMYSLEEGRKIPLRHDLFDEDAIVLKNMAREISLRSAVSGRGLTVSYPDMPYLGIWHRPETDAPYVCIEPWSTLPSRQDVVEDFLCKSDMIRLAPGKTYENIWTVTVF